MRRVTTLGCVLVLAACSTKDAPPATDTTTAAAPAEPVAPAPITLESVAGKWNSRVMATDNDSTLTTHVLTASADPTGWSLLQPTGAVVPLRNVTAAGDSITAEASNFKSGVRAGMTVKALRIVYRLQGEKLTGNATAKYETKSADSVRQFRFEGTKQ